MKKEDKNLLINELTETLTQNSNIYLADISNLNVETTNELRRLCFKRDITIKVVKNTLLRKAMEKSGKDFEDLYNVLKGPTSIMISETSNGAAKLIKEFRTSHSKPLLKGAYVEEMCFVGDNQLDALVAVKSKNELIADVIALLQTPAKTVISSLQSGGNKLAGIVKTLSEKE